MDLKDAILKSLDEIGDVANYATVYEHIVKNGYYSLGGSTPKDTISSSLGRFIREGDTRVKRIKQPGETYVYYLTKNEDKINVDKLSESVVSTNSNPVKIEKNKTYHERELHKLLSTFLNGIGIHAKTIFHEQSSQVDSHQTWTHPDMVGIEFLVLRSSAGKNLLDTINIRSSIKFSSFEIKKEINSDSELKKAFFQAVSNSSWANYAYLVAFEFGNSNELRDEMERLNQSFGIGIIELGSNPFQSRILFHPRYRDLDFKTIDKLCNNNEEFKKFIDSVGKTLRATEHYHHLAKDEMLKSCDDFFTNEEQVNAYLIEKRIPSEKKE
jgi:hypothetical protein